MQPNQPAWMVPVSFGLLAICLASVGSAQMPPTNAQVNPGNWRSPVGAGAPTGNSSQFVNTNNAASQPSRPSQPRPHVAKVSNGGGLPKDKGQVWKTYDISPYSQRVKTTSEPHQTVMEWIFYETGYQTWHGDVASLLSANPRNVMVYHTPEVQDRVHTIIDRFVYEKNSKVTFGLRVFSMANSSWRVRAQSMLTPIQTESQGIQAFVIRREDMALLVSDSSRRADFRELGNPALTIINGENFSHVATRIRNFTKGVAAHPGMIGGVTPQLGQVDEGYSLSFSPLLDMDETTAEAVLKLKVNQVEKLVGLNLNVPSPLGAQQTSRTEIPQIVQFGFSERFRWPADHVLIVDVGLVPNPNPTSQNVLSFLGMESNRANILMIIECKGHSPINPVPPGTASQPTPGNYHGRY